MKIPWHDQLRRLGACKDACDWARAYPTFEAAWLACERPEWMFWLLGRLDDRISIVRVACAIARSVAHLTTDPRSIAAIECAERWVADSTRVDSIILRDAANAAAYAANATYAAANAAYAAYAAADAAAYAAANAAAYAAASAANAADYAANAAGAAYDAAYAACCSRVSRCDLVRALAALPTLPSTANA